MQLGYLGLASILFAGAHLYNQGRLQAIRLRVCADCWGSRYLSDLLSISLA